MRELYNHLGHMEFDGLIAGLVPQVHVGAGVIKALSASTEIKRGTVFAKNGDGKLVILGTTAGSGETLTPDCILADDVTVGTSDVNVAVYDMGCFNENKIIVKSGYTVTEADRDKLRERGIYLEAVAE